MALSTEGILAVRRKAFNYLTGGTKGDPFAYQQLKALFSHLSQHGLNPDLQFVPFSDLNADTIIADAACKVYAIYLKKQATSTASYFKARDHASATSGTADEMVVELNAANQAQLITNPLGWAQGTGLTVGADSGIDANTNSSAGDGPNGFVILGAP